MVTLQRLSIAVFFTLAFGAGAASARQLPQYEVMGLPISPLQMSAVGPRDVHEQPPAPALTLDGMPASPHQIAVIRDHHLTVN